jgi:hypothetical protein
MKTRTIIVTTSSEHRSGLEKDYGIHTIASPKTVTFEMKVPDSSETYKKLSKDPRVKDWSFQEDRRGEPEITGMSNPRRAVDIFDTYDLKDLKTVLRIIGGFKRTIEFYLISDSASKTTLDKETLLCTALENPTSTVPTIVSAELTKKVLLCMAGGPAELKKILTTGFNRMLNSSIPVDSLSFEGFCDMLITEGNK